MKKFLIVLLLIIAVVAGGALFYINSIGGPYDPSNTESISVETPEGKGASAIGEILEQNGIIESALKFKLFLKFSGFNDVMKAGTYMLSPSMSMEEIVQKLVENKVETMSFTIPEGLTLKQTAQKLADQGMGSYEVFLDEMQNGTFNYDWLQNNSLEGYLFPNTYSVPMDYTEHDIINTMLAQFEISVMSYYQDVSSPVKSELTLNEILAAASIIERECKVDDERPLVASVIYNRIHQSIKLEMCSTVQYILLETTGEVKEDLTYADMAIESPYNTYLHFGLPPGPICSPGMASIKAALEPADTNYLYFVLSAKLDGTSEFTADYNEFLRYKDAYWAAHTAG